MSYIFDAIPVNAQQVALQLSNRDHNHANNSLSAERDPPDHFIVSVHGGENKNRLRFDFADTESYKRMTKESGKTPDLNAKNWVVGNDIENIL